MPTRARSVDALRLTPAHGASEPLETSATGPELLPLDGLSEARPNALLTSGVATGKLVLTAPGAAGLGARPAMRAAVFDKAIDLLATEYLHADTSPSPPIDRRALTMSALRELLEVDPSLSLREGPRGRLELWHQGQLRGAFGAPPHSAVTGWGELVARVIDAARVRSPLVGSLDVDELYARTLKAMTRPLDDYTSYKSPSAVAASEKADKADDEEDAAAPAQGELGVRFALRAGRLELTDVVTGSPADRAGLLPGDIILSIDGTAPHASDTDAVVGKLRGPMDSTVRLRVARLPQPVEVVRGKVKRSDVEGRRVGAHALVRVREFKPGTGKRFYEALTRLVEGGAQGLILDLRGNNGGRVSEFVAIADALLEEGPIATLVGRKKEDVSVYQATPGDLLQGRPVVVLIDAESASSSELLAAALQQRGRAVFVGHTTFGKGIAQYTADLPHGGGLKLTYQRHYGPLGISAHGVGITPSLCTAGFTTADEAMAALRAGRRGPQEQLGAIQRLAERSPTMRKAARTDCPSAESYAPMEVEVARRLLDNPELYQRALATMSRALSDPQPIP